VERDHPQTNVNQTFISQTGGTGDAGDKYVGLDQFGRVVDDLWINTSTSTTTDEFQYGYDQDGNVLYRNNTVNTAFGELDTYTAENELATFARGTLNSTHTGLVGSASASQNFVTDAVGNFTSMTTNGTTQTRTANAQNEITSISGATTPTYDSNGNMTGDQNGNQFVYDAWNRLVTVKNSSGTTLESFSYDGLNRRVTQTASGTTTDLFYSDQGQVLEEMVGGAATARYVWSPVYVNAMVLRDRATGAPGTLNERLWVQQDANWNVTALVNGSGAVVERYVYSPYGMVTIYNASYTTVLSSSAYNWVYGFQGMRYDSISGLNEADARWYSPTLGRWVTMDPIRYSAGDVDLYRFVGNDPTGATDPSGFDCGAIPSSVNDAGDYFLAAVEEAGRPKRTECAKTFRVPDYVLRAANLAWWETLDDKKEHPASFILPKGGIDPVTVWGKAGTEGSSWPVQPEEGEGFIGTIHTHPDGPDGSYPGGFSGFDIGTFVNGRGGNTMYVRSSKCIYVLIGGPGFDMPSPHRKQSIGEQLSEVAWKSAVQKEFDRIYDDEKGTHEQRMNATIAQMAKALKLCFYRVCEAGNQPIGNEATLVTVK
jgi:RHS repeat-associated protein